MRRVLVIALLVVIAATSAMAASASIARTDHAPDGNRVVPDCGPLGTSTIVDIDLEAAPTWVIPDPADPGASWLVAMEDGSVVRARGGEADDGPGHPQPALVATLPPGEPPMASQSADGALTVESALGTAALFDDPIPDARVIQAPDGSMVALTGPTEQYPHGALGDSIEASDLTIRRPDGTAERVGVGPTFVIEGLAPILADLARDERPEIIVTASDMYEGARLVVLDLDGARIATGPPIGRGFRWLHQVAAGPVGPDGETEIIVVRTPHIGGILEAWRLVDGRLARVARAAGYSSHQLGSTNLDMALLADADCDGRLDVVVPTQDMRTLARLTRRGDGFELLDELPLGDMLATNLAAAPEADGRLVLAAGTTDGRLRIFA